VSSLLLGLVLCFFSCSSSAQYVVKRWEKAKTAEHKTQSLCLPPDKSALLACLLRGTGGLLLGTKAAGVSRSGSGTARDTRTRTEFARYLGSFGDWGARLPPKRHFRVLAGSRCLADCACPPLPNSERSTEVRARKLFLKGNLEPKDEEQPDSDLVLCRRWVLAV
jgi:hypothetical protein